MENINNDFKDNSKQIISRSWYHSEDVEVNFRDYNSKEERNIVKADANYIYKRSLESKDNRYSKAIDSEISKVNYYSVVYDSKRYLPNGKLVNETDAMLEYEYSANPYYCSILINELNRLAKKDNMYINISFNENKEFGSCFVTVKSLTKEKFESLYGISLDDYYDTINHKINRGVPDEETQLREKVAQLKKDYFHYLIEDIDKGFDKSNIEMDAYITYLKLSCTFENVANKEEIFREFGFEIDNQNCALIYKPNKDKKLELK